MGKRGDQIQRLFRSPADVYMIQYWGQIDESIIEQMEKLATAKSALELRKIFYGVIDGIFFNFFPLFARERICFVC